MLSKRQLSELPDHRLKAYLKSVRKSLYVADASLAYANSLGVGKFDNDDLEKHFAEVKAECAKRPHFSK